MMDKGHQPKSNIFKRLMLARHAIKETFDDMKAEKGRELTSLEKNLVRIKIMNFYEVSPKSINYNVLEKALQDRDALQAKIPHWKKIAAIAVVLELSLAFGLAIHNSQGFRHQVNQYCPPILDGYYILLESLSIGKTKRLDDAAAWGIKA